MIAQGSGLYGVCHTATEMTQVPEYSTLSEMLKDQMKRRGLTAAELAERSGVPLSTVNAYLQGQRGKRGIPAERASKLFHAVGVSEEQVAAASGAFAVGRVFTMNFDAALERAVQEARESVPLPNRLRLRQNEVERELIEIGATDQEVADFRRSVRDNPLLAALFRGGAPQRLTNEEMLQLFDGVAEGFKAIITQLVKERTEAKRRG